MKARLTVKIEEDLIPQAKRYARSRGMSLSQLIETSLRGVIKDEELQFSQRWRGRFEPAGQDDERYNSLAKRYL